MDSSIEMLIRDKTVSISRPRNSNRFYMRVGKHGDKRIISRKDATAILRLAESKKQNTFGWGASSLDDFLAKELPNGGEWTINPC